MAKKVCDFCLSESKGLLSGFERLADGRHYICKDCKSILKKNKLPIKYDLFQCLVTAQGNMRDMIMDAYLDENEADEAIARFYPMPPILLHGGEKCVNVIPATITVQEDLIPIEPAVTAIVDVNKNTIHNIPDGDGPTGNKTVEGTFYETDAGLYFLSKNFINCHRLGNLFRNTSDNSHLHIQTPTKSFTYTIENAEIFFLRERFFNKVVAAKHNKKQRLIFMSNDNKVTITPGIYEIPKSLRPGLYRVSAIKDQGLHIKDSDGRVFDYYETESAIELVDGGILECTGEYQLQWIGDDDIS